MSYATKMTGMNIIEAIIAMRTGHRVGRLQWEITSGKKMPKWLVPLVVEEHGILPSHLMVQENAKVKANVPHNGDQAKYEAQIWLPTIDDLTASDYKIVRINRRMETREKMAAEN